MNLKRLSMIFETSQGSMPNTGTLEKQTITIWYNIKTGDIYCAGPGNPRIGTKSCSPILLKYDRNTGLPLAEIANSGIIIDRPLKKVLNQVDYFRQMKGKKA